MGLFGSRVEVEEIPDTAKKSMPKWVVGPEEPATVCGRTQKTSEQQYKESREKLDAIAASRMCTSLYGEKNAPVGVYCSPGDRRCNLTGHTPTTTGDYAPYTDNHGLVHRDGHVYRGDKIVGLDQR